MKVLFNDKFLNYNQASNYEGVYRIEAFAEKYPSTECGTDPTPFLLDVHSNNYFEDIWKACDRGNELVGIDMSPESFEAALCAVSMTIEASETGNFAVVRPPGHHAGRERASGFCLFNNMAIAVIKLLKEGTRVAVLDLDGHHGDGTQDLLTGIDNVLFCSIHESGVFPGTGHKSSDNYVNFPLRPPISSEEYMKVFDDALGNLNEFNPDILGVSIGFDTYEKDKLLDFQLSEDDYEQIGKLIKSNFTNTFAVLEGGYHNNILECIESFISGINSVSKK